MRKKKVYFFPKKKDLEKQQRELERFEAEARKRVAEYMKSGAPQKFLNNVRKLQEELAEQGLNLDDVLLPVGSRNKV